MSYVCFANYYGSNNTAKSHKKHLRLCFRFCEFCNNQTRQDDKPRSLASDGDTMTTSLVKEFFFSSFICASTAKSDQHSPILHCK